MQTSQEELRSTNEELQSTNEELQSTNEELTTSKEEMQSLNEELQTVNAELQAKMDELVAGQQRHEEPAQQHGHRHRCSWTTTSTCGASPPQATKIIKLIPGDVGRPITDIATDLLYPELTEDAREVLRTLAFFGKADHRPRRPLVHGAHHALPHAGRPD